MTGLLARIATRFRRFAGAETGSATVEFVIIFPLFMTLFISSFESGMLMTRHVILERALDIAVRDVRLSTGEEYSHAELKQMICDRADLIPDCSNQLKLEMVARDPSSWVDLPQGVDCVDRSDPGLPSRNFQNGVSHQLMILRACILLDPFFPSSGLGLYLPRESGDAYALVSTSVFVMEPQN